MKTNYKVGKERRGRPLIAVAGVWWRPLLLTHSWLVPCYPCPGTTAVRSVPKLHPHFLEASALKL